VSTTLTFNFLETALNAESWEWLQDDNINLARALHAEVNRGATAEDVRRFVTRYTGRPALAARMEQAAAYLAAQQEVIK